MTTKDKQRRRRKKEGRNEERNEERNEGKKEGKEGKKERRKERKERRKEGKKKKDHFLFFYLNRFVYVFQSYIYNKKKEKYKYLTMCNRYGVIEAMYIIVL